MAWILLPSAPMQGLQKGLAAMSMLFYLMAVGLPGICLTWGWLYLAWPAHRRVCCWAAVAGLLGVWALPPSALTFLPLYLAIAMLGAVMEQAIAARRVATTRVGADVQAVYDG